MAEVGKKVSEMNEEELRAFITQAVSEEISKIKPKDSLEYGEYVETTEGRVAILVEKVSGIEKTIGTLATKESVDRLNRVVETLATKESVDNLSKVVDSLASKESVDSLGKRIEDQLDGLNRGIEDQTKDINGIKEVLKDIIPKGWFIAFATAIIVMMGGLFALIGVIISKLP